MDFVVFGFRIYYVYIQFINRNNSGGLRIWIGIDDTDSKKHGCTTYLVNEIISEFSDYSVIGYPYLVRLNPIIPWKTRGNGAVCLRLEKQGDGDRFKIGNNDHGEPLDGYSINPNKDKATSATGVELSEALVRVENIISTSAALDDQSTNPGVVISGAVVPIELYWDAVRSVVKLSKIKDELTSLGLLYKGFKKGRGIIGASAAIAWGSNVIINPNNQSTGQSKSKLDHTYELIAYRSEPRWGTPRQVNTETVLELDRRFTSTFNNYDYETGHIAITPNSPCPVLFGVRGDSVPELHETLKFITESDSTEPIDKWLIFCTNQGTDDHVIPMSISQVRPYTSVIVTGMVYQEPYSISGGHVLFNLTDMTSEPQEDQDDCPSNTEPISPGSARITCAAYEPTKGFRSIVRDLLPGDIIRVYGSIRPEPKSINIEKLEIDTMINKMVKIHNPKCPNCGRAMKSIGYLKGYRCRKCHEIMHPESVPLTLVERNIKPGYYEVPVCARRHLAKPLKRM